MCGIAGIFSRDHSQDVDAERLHAMADLQRHRGPDNLDVKIYPGAGFAHNRLSLLDPSANGNQPYFDEHHVLVYNGEIYNWRELRDELQRRYSISFSSNCDTEVLFHLLVREGPERALSRLQGMFAFGFYDLRQRELVLARDRIGIKPLFYHLDQGRVHFASELKALSRILNPPVDHVLLLGTTLGSMETSRCLTAHQDTLQVEPGGLVRFSARQWHARETWFRTADLIDPAYYRELDRLTSEQAVAEFRRLLCASVDKMLIADASIGAFVSGGIDSSLISVLARECGKTPRLYSVNVAGPLSEIDSARLLAREIGSELFEYEFQPHYFTRDWVRAAWHYDVPLVKHQHAVPFSNLTALAREHQDKAVLTGEGADEMFMGYVPDIHASIAKRFDPFLRRMDKFLGRLPFIGRRGKSGGPQFASQLSMLSNRYEAEERREHYVEALQFLPTRRLQELHQNSLELIDTTLHSLLWRNDRMGMMHSIESRFPYLDEAIMRFGVNLPVRFKVGWTRKTINKGYPFLMDKYVIRKLAEKSLPPALFRKRKHPFTIHGFNDMEVDAKVLEDGYVQQTLQLSSQDLSRIGRFAAPRYLPRLVGLEIWGRLQVLGQTPDAVSDLVQRYCTIRRKG